MSLVFCFPCSSLFHSMFGLLYILNNLGGNVPEIPLDQLAAVVTMVQHHVFENIGLGIQVIEGCAELSVCVF